VVAIYIRHLPTTPTHLFKGKKRLGWVALQVGVGWGLLVQTLQNGRCQSWGGNRVHDKYVLKSPCWSWVCRWVGEDLHLAPDQLTNLTSIFYVAYMQGTFKRPVSLHNLVYGMEFGHQLSNLPRSIPDTFPLHP
jgi:hypothetical protein